MIFLTSPSSSEALADLGSAECSVLTEEAEKDTVLLLSLSCCGEMEGGGRGGGEGEREGETCRHMAGSEMSHQVSTVWVMEVIRGRESRKQISIKTRNKNIWKWLYFSWTRVKKEKLSTKIWCFGCNKWSYVCKWRWWMERKALASVGARTYSFVIFNWNLKRTPQFGIHQLFGLCFLPLPRMRRMLRSEVVSINTRLR